MGSATRYIVKPAVNLYNLAMNDPKYKCPACSKRSSTKQGILMHFFRALEGLGSSPSEHIEWAKKKGVSRERTLFGGPKDSEGLPSGDLKSLKEVLYEYLGD